jgi:hypothetical protein
MIPPSELSGMNIDVYICIRISTYMFMYPHIYVSICVWTYIHMCTYIYKDKEVKNMIRPSELSGMNIYIHVYLNSCLKLSFLYVYPYIGVYTYIHMYVYIHIYPYVYVHI